jgi:hypothetical protein
LAGEADNHLAMGIAADVIVRVSQIRQLMVRPTSAIQKYAGAQRSALEAGREFGVDAVLEGTLQRDAGRVRVTSWIDDVASRSENQAGMRAWWAHAVGAPRIQPRKHCPIIFKNQFEDVPNVRPWKSPLHTPAFAIVHAGAGSVATRPDSCPSHDGTRD